MAKTAFKAKFPGQCIVCAQGIRRGQAIYHDGGGYRHTDCEAVSRASAQPPNPVNDPILGAEERLNATY